MKKTKKTAAGAKEVEPAMSESLEGADDPANSGGRTAKPLRALESSGPVLGSGQNSTPSTEALEDGLVEFIVANRRAFQDDEGRKRCRDTTDGVVDSLKAGFDLMSEIAQPEADGHHIAVLRGTHAELSAKFLEINHDHLILDSVVHRHPAVATQPLVQMLRATPSAQDPAGEQSLRLSLVVDGAPLRGARVDLYLVDSDKQSATLTGRSDGSGAVAFSHAPAFVPVAVQVEPSGGAWAVVQHSPRDGSTINLPPLQLQGPMGWWQLAVGAPGWNIEAGAGIKVGVADTGFGPHPFLSHVTGIGAFVGGTHDATAAATADVSNHGTHVCGIIGARPTDGSKGYAGVAPGAELYCARVFQGATATNVDIAAAVDEFADYYHTDLVNLSLGGPASALEADAILYAYQRGTVCICAAGNGGQTPISFPAALPYSVAVSAVGLAGQAPAGSLSAQNMPQQPDKITGSGLYLASFSNFGNGVSVAAPGDGIISTVPATEYDPAPYMPMCGTSMAAPATTGALAALLSRNATYKEMPRDIRRSQVATSSLLRAARDIGLQAVYQGSGLAREHSPGAA